MKWIALVLLLLVGGTWAFYANTGSKMEELRKRTVVLIDEGDPEGEVPKIESEINSLENQKTLNGILLTFLTAGVLGITAVVYVLPLLAQKATHSVYDSGEEIQHTAQEEARVALAQGDYPAAIAAFRKAAAEEPGNRLPWLEIAKIQRGHDENPFGAIQTLKDALKSHEWPEDDRAFFLFRLAELYDQVSDRDQAAGVLRQVIEELPETRHAANARHKLHEFGVA
jgi:tetratricopeptide (TPR) repeat protein